MNPPAVRRGEVLPWPSLVAPPPGYQFLPHWALVGRMDWAGIVAMEDHAERPVLPEEFLEQIAVRADKQGDMLRGEKT